MQIRLIPAPAVSVLLLGCPGQVPTAPGAALTAAKQIPVGQTPHGIAAANGFVYNSNTGDATISVIDAATDSVVKTLTVEGGKPGYLKPFRDGKHLLALDTQQGRLLVIDTSSHEVVQTVELGHGPDKIVVSEDDRVVLVTMTGEPKLLQLGFGEDRQQTPSRKELAVGTVAGAEGGHGHRAIGYAAGWAVTPSSGENQVQLIDVGAGTVKTVSDGN